MATQPVKMLTEESTLVLTWEGLAGGDDGDPARVGNAYRLTAQVIGDATTVAIEGSNDGTNWSPMDDMQGTAIALAGATSDVREVAGVPLFIRPVATGGADSDVIVVGKLR